MGKRSKQYALKRRESRRRAKRIARRKGEVDSMNEEDKMLNAQSSKHSFQEENTPSKDPDQARQSLEELRANYKRVRELLNMEQRRPRVFEKECLRCLRHRNEKVNAAKNKLRVLMFSGETFGSRYLLAAIAKHQRHRKLQ